MRTLTLTSASILLACSLATPAFAQPKRGDTSSVAAAAPPACEKTTIKRHDHGAERYLPTLSRRGDAAPCPPAAAASQGARSGAAKPAHDHGKVHKNQ